MKKILNNQSDILKEMLEGISKIHAGKVKIVGNCVVSTNIDESKVSLISGGGSGHEPSHAGFVGSGMLDAAVCGEVFTSPTPFDVLEAIKAVPNKNGVLLIIKNYSGDVMNFEMAQQMAIDEGIKVDSIIVDDDIAVKDSLYTQGRRGVAGTVLIHKILGHFAKHKKSLSELKEIGTKIIENVKTIGIGLEPCVVLSSGKESFELAKDKIEYGCGIHGEPGASVESIGKSKDYAKKILKTLDDETKFDSKKEYLLLINGLGRTTPIELSIFANDIHNNLKEYNANIVKTLCGNYMISLDMEGVSVSILNIFDKEILEALNSKVDILGNLF